MMEVDGNGIGNGNGIEQENTDGLYRSGDETEVGVISNVLSSPKVLAAAQTIESVNASANANAGAGAGAKISSVSWITLFCRCLTCCNCMLMMILTGLVLYEMNQVQTIQVAMEDNKAMMQALQDEVREKQETQIEELHQEVRQEHNLTFLTLAGIFTLLTCLISIFHISTHITRMNQPIIQRKIVAILWMSPIYSVTSLITLLYPPMEGGMAIIKDFYESYCIYTFLSFLIVVLGKGSRDNAVEVLAVRAQELETPTKLLSHWYEPPPETSDFAKANAIITQCQIYAMQFVFIRPLTTVIYVIYKAVLDGDLEEENNENVGSMDDSTAVASSTDAGATNGDNIGNRLLRWLQEATITSNSTNMTTIDTMIPMASPIPMPMPMPNTLPTIGTVDDFSEFEPTAMPISPQEDFTEATKAYFQSFGFVLAMIVNISVLFAFTGLLKLYHSVHNDLAWCRPWPKFLTIKGVVFLTFWQGLAILIFVNLDSDNQDSNDSPTDRGRRYQNILICCEMLFFSLTHWCVFPAEEWQKGYEPPTSTHKAGIGLQDFVTDVSHIYRRRRRRRPTRFRMSPRRAAEYQRAGSSYMSEEEESETVPYPIPKLPSRTSPQHGNRVPKDEDDDYSQQSEDIAPWEDPLQPPTIHYRKSNAEMNRSRFLSDGSAMKADDEDDGMELI